MRSCVRSSPDFAEPLTVTIGRSRWLVPALICVHALALAAAALTPVVIGWRLALSALVLASAVDSLRRYGGLGSARRIVAVREHAGAYSVRLAGSEGFVPAILTGFTPLPFALLMAFRIPPARWPHGTAIVSDAVDAQTFQHLRARLELRGGRAPIDEAL